MADKVGVINTDNIKEKSKHKHNHKNSHHKNKKYRSRKRDSEDYEFTEELYKKELPECIRITRDVERRKEIIKMKEKHKRKREKQKMGSRNPGKYGNYGGYNSSSDDDLQGFKGMNGFNNGGSYKIKGGNFGSNRKTMFNQRG